MTTRQQMTYITLGLVLVSLWALASRWAILADRVPLQMTTSAAVARPQNSSKTPVDKPATKSAPAKKMTKYPSKLVNLNQANSTELERLPGIGPVLAQRIVAYRKKHGPYRRVDDLDKVEGIGEKKLVGLKGLITVRD